MKVQEIYNLILNYNNYINVRLSEDQLVFFWQNASIEQLEKACEIIDFKKALYPISLYQGHLNNGGYLVRGSNLNVLYHTWHESKQKAEEVQKKRFNLQHKIRKMKARQ